MSYSKKDIETRMDGALNALSTDFAGLRTGRASVNLLDSIMAVSYTHLRAHETREDLVCRLLLEKKKV